jgi:hypothetical protein
MMLGVEAAQVDTLRLLPQLHLVSVTQLLSVLELHPPAVLLKVLMAVRPRCFLLPQLAVAVVLRVTLVGQP